MDIVNSDNIQLTNFDISLTTLNGFKRNKGIDIVFQNISYSVNVLDQTQKSVIPCQKTYAKKQILINISGIFKASECTAIMGASGAGKTTLLNILACRISPNDGGKLYANNFQYNYQTFGDFANYVMQSDVLMETLTVRETLEFAATLKLNLNEIDKKARVIQLANQLKLQKCLDTLIGGVIVKGISGGQKKRTSIAFQLISDPQVVFLDEPTSGLDSLTSYIIVSQLKKLARKYNKTVIMTIHQPNSQIYSLFDNLNLLLQGKIIYQNNAQNVLKYFEQNFNMTCAQFVNPPDFVMAKIHHQDQKNIALYSSYFQTYQKNQKSRIQNMIQKKNTSQIAFRKVQVNLLTGLSALIYRNILNSIRNPMLIKSKLFQGIFLSLFIGGLYFDIGIRDYTNIQNWYSITGFLFFMCISGTMSALAPVTLTFPLQRDVFFKQQDSKMYNVPIYFLAKIIIELPQLIIVPLVTTCIHYFMIDLSNSTQQYFIYLLITFLLLFSGSSLGLFLGSVILDPKSVSVAVPILTLPLFLFSGFFKNRSQLPVWIGWIQYISPLKYGFTAFVSNQTSYKQSLVNQLHFDVLKWQAIIILFSLGIFFRLFTLFFLWSLRKRNQ